MVVRHSRRGLLAAGITLFGSRMLGRSLHTAGMTAEPACAPAASSASPVASPYAAERVAVRIERFVFVPRELTVAVGTRVVWSNRDGAAHTVTADNGAFDSDHLSFSERFGYTFTQPGVYTYYCAFHANMTGIVTVTGDPTPACATTGEATPTG